MSITDVLPWLNLLLPPIFMYVVRMEHRITRLEASREAERELRAAVPCLREPIRG